MLNKIYRLKNLEEIVGLAGFLYLAILATLAVVAIKHLVSTLLFESFLPIAPSGAPAVELKLDAAKEILGEEAVSQ